MIHLHRHSEFSLLDGTGNAEQYADVAEKLGHSHLALTDHGTLSGVLHHINACEKRGIIPIAGVEAYFKPNRLRKEQDNKEYWHMVLLAKNEKGWHNLLRITSEAYQSGFYYKPCIDYELLEKHNEGLIVGTACVSGYIPDMIAQNDIEYQVHLEKLRKLFGDDMYIEIMPHDFDKQRALNKELVNFANQHGIPYAATIDAHYPFKDWYDTQDVMLMIATGQSLSQRKEKQEKGEDVYKFNAKTLYLASEDDTRAFFKEYHPDLPDHVIDTALSNTHVIANKVEPFSVDKSLKLPKAGSANDAMKTLRGWCNEGMQRIGKVGDKQYEDQIEHEIKIFADKGVVDYFVIIGDMVRWAKQVGIRVGAGRGSAAGSLVSYLVGITAIDPIAHGLLFERFLNPHREGLPDIDLDFQHNRRAEVKEYLGKRWGTNHVADIVAHQTFGMRAALQSVARVFDVPYEEMMKVTNSFDDKTGELKLADIREISPDLDYFASKYPEVWKHAIRIEGQIKAISKHAAGVVVTDKPITEYMPTMRGNDDTTVTAWSQRAEFPIIDEYGFLKIDVLGTDGLTIQDTACRLINENAGKEVITHEYLDNLTISPDLCEPEVLKAFGENMTLGVFQFESRGITGLLKQIKPNKFGDVAAANALYRPGPLEGGIAFDYGSIKNGKKQLEYWHESVEPALGETYGLMVYQEQVMQIAQALGDFTLAEAATLQKAMTKWQSTKIKTNKGRDAMNKFFVKFEEGCSKKGLSKQEVEAIWEKVLQFSIYGFNKSHSAGYAAQAYQDMWLKINYPVEFYAALLTWETAKVPQVIREAQGRGIKILPPDVNKSKRGFTVDGDAIRFGLEAIKGVGDAAIEVIEAERANGEFKSYQDFADRVPARKCNARVKNALEGAGAFDKFGSRSELNVKEKATLERQLMGFALSTGSQIENWKQVIEPRIDDEDAFVDNNSVTIGGEIISKRQIKDRKGRDMGFFEMAYGQRQWSCTVFFSTWDKVSHMLNEGEIAMVRGNVDERGNVIVYDMCLVEDLVKVIEETNAG